MPEVRRATLDDVPAIVDLLEAVAAEGRWLGTEAGFDREARIESITASFRAAAGDGEDPGAEPYVSFLVHDPDGALIGDLNMTIRSYGVAYLGMMVADGHRGEGIGSALLAESIAWAREQGAHKISLEMWPDNDAARALYEKFGFEQEGLLRDHYRRKDGELRSAVSMGLLLDGAPSPTDR
jgi:RimJ/RimL family protein N-acetyltransferase